MMEIDAERARRETPGCGNVWHFNKVGAAVLLQPDLDATMLTGSVVVRRKLLMLRATRSVPVGASSERATDMLSFMAITGQVEVVTWRPSRMPLSRGRPEGDATR